MLVPRPTAARGHFDHGWLETHHSFSFADYFDPDHMGFRSLRVINEDTIAPGRGFGMHGHRNMEIVTIVLSGSLRHEDSMGNGAAILPGEVQRMTAGSGVRHSEFNASETEPLHLLQIWIEPDRAELPPSYEQTHFDEGGRTDRLQLVASPDGREGSVTIHQDATLHRGRLTAGAEVTHRFSEGRGGWLQVIAGEVIAGPHPLVAGDGLAIEGEPEITIRSDGGGELLLFDLA